VNIQAGDPAQPPAQLEEKNRALYYVCIRPIKHDRLPSALAIVLVTYPNLSATTTELLLMFALCLHIFHPSDHI